IVQLADIVPNEFALRVTAPEHIEPGMLYRVAGHTESSDTGQAIAGVPIRATLKNATTGALIAESESVTNNQGQSYFEFRLAKDSPKNATLALTAFKDGDFETQLIGVDIEPNSSITINTDKPLYQPGQTVHCRTLVLGRDSHQAQADVDVKMVLWNERRETIA